MTQPTVAYHVTVTMTNGTIEESVTTYVWDDEMVAMSLTDPQVADCAWRMATPEEIADFVAKGEWAREQQSDADFDYGFNVLYHQMQDEDAFC